MRQENYKKLCLELFGTTDVRKLRSMAEQIQPEEAEKPGRNRRFSAGDVADMERMLAQGRSICEIAASYQTSRQMVRRCVNRMPEPGCTLRIEYFSQNQVCTIIDVDGPHKRLWIQNRTNDMLHRAFGTNEHPNWDDLTHFLEARCVPRTRGHLQAILNSLKMDEYDPLQLAERTQGRTAEDNMWLKFHHYPGRSGK